ncbi:30S ribosomal protein S27ae [Candidatus Pacearchaeota archaeon]|nr:30S ribosomal protein S27ae [Candidatus Pacearchaeota archaeon]
MAAPTGGSGKGDKKGKKKHINKPTSQKYKHYTIQGDSVKRGKSCPRCGAGIFLANHGTRLYCGKCHYTEFMEKKA